MIKTKNLTGFLTHLNLKIKQKKYVRMYLLQLKKIKKSIMAPMVSSSKIKEEQIEITDKEILNEKNKYLKLRNYIEKNFEYVGKDFSKKVREVYYDKKNKKAIYGTTTAKEREDLAEEGIDLLSIPWVNKDN